MGSFRLVIDGVGGHGDDRTAKEGEDICIPMKNYLTPDQAAKICVDVMRSVSGGEHSFRAKLIHWPDTPTEVVDDLVGMKRVKGNF